jgi:hypothetical protein
LASSAFIPPYWLRHVIGLFTDAQLLGRLHDRGALGLQLFGLTKLADDLFRGVSSSCHVESLLPGWATDSHITWTQPEGSRQQNCGETLFIVAGSSPCAAASCTTLDSFSQQSGVDLTEVNVRYASPRQWSDPVDRQP